MKPRLAPLELNSVAQWREFQRLMATALFRPLTPGNRMQSRWMDGRKTSEVAEEFIKPNDRLTSFERLELYSRQYWFRVLDCFYDDFPGLRAVLGEQAFLKMAQAYLAEYPSTSFSLRNLGSRLEKFLRQQPQWCGRRLPLALEVVRFEWAQIVAFDGESRPPINQSVLTNHDPKKLRLALQPYLTLLALEFPVDEFVVSLKKHEALRGEASNAKDSAPKTGRVQKRSLPKKEGVFVVVHRHNNALYYKRLEPAAFYLLDGLQKKLSVEQSILRVLRKNVPGFTVEQVGQWFELWASLGWFYQPKSR